MIVAFKPPVDIRLQEANTQDVQNVLVRYASGWIPARSAVIIIGDIVGDSHPMWKRGTQYAHMSEGELVIVNVIEDLLAHNFYEM